MICEGWGPRKTQAGVDQILVNPTLQDYSPSRHTTLPSCRET